MSIHHTAHARIGLLGNPSDGYHGKCISLALENFSAEVVLTPQAQLEFVPHPLCDGGRYGGVDDFLARTAGEGYAGGVRLLKAACRVFFEHCREQQLALDAAAGNFRLEYSTAIPRQAGLSGSSALVTAALACLAQHFRVPLAPEARPALALAAEAALGITAGLQDRVIQVYQGAVFMDFGAAHLAQHGRGRYEALPAACLPPLWLVWCANPSDSGGVHSTVRERYRAEAGESGPLHRAMTELASLAERGRAALLEGDHAELARLMDRNFDVRRQVFGDEVLGPTNLKMVAVARGVGAAAKFTGSGGAIVAFCPQGAPQAERLQAACQAAGFDCQAVRVAEPRFDCSS